MSLLWSCDGGCFFFSNKSSVISFSALSNIFHEDLQKLQLVQKQSFWDLENWITSAKVLSHWECSKKNCDKLEINDAVMVFKCLNNLVPKYLLDQLKK